MKKNVSDQKSGNETATIRHLIGERLKTRALDQTTAPDAHLDEDALCAFVEGRLAEASTVIGHLIACSSCRHTTALLIRSGSQLETGSEATPIESPGPGSTLLERLAAGLTPSIEEDVVFAYQEPEPAPDENAESGPKKLEDKK